MEMRSKWNDERLDAQFAHIDDRFDGLEKRFDRLEGRFDRLQIVLIVTLASFLAAFAAAQF